MWVNMGLLFNVFTLYVNTKLGIIELNNFCIAVSCIDKFPQNINYVSKLGDKVVDFLQV